MPIPLFNSIASWFLKKRIHQMELFMKYPNEVQQELLHGLLNSASKTEVGIKNIFWPSPIKWFAKSSGTSNARSKFIPISNESLEDCHYKAGKDMLSIYYYNNEEAQILAGKCLRLGGSSELYQNTDSYFGDLSAIIIDNLPFWAELGSTPSQKVSLMSEWEAKMEAIISETLGQKVTSLAGVPSWMLVLLQNVLKKTHKTTISDVWPMVEVYFHGGVSFHPYRKQFEKLFQGTDLNFFEIYNASEGFFGMQDQNDSTELLLMLDYGIFYEFIPLDQPNRDDTEIIIPLSEIELGKNYAMVISTNAGLWRYKIGDTIKFTSLSPYRIQITGRTKNHINVFGEELMIENAEVALSKAAKIMDLDIVDYTVGPIFMEDHKKGAHQWLIEFKTPPEDTHKFTELLDRFLKELNSDYEAKRYKDMTLEMPKVNIAKKKLFYNWMAQKNKLGGQHKVPRLSNQRDLLEELLEINH
jgi:hypothetical protein